MRYYAPILLLLIAILPIRSATKRALLIGISDYPIHMTWQNYGQYFVAQKLIKIVKLKCCGI